jgi:hypothetical protein
MARFPDSRINTARLSSQPLLPTDFAAGRAPSDSANATLLAYSGGTVWASHPLPMAAEVYVRLSNVWLAPDERSITDG